MGASQSGHGPSCSCDLSLVIYSSKQLEALLETKFQATGKGLHEKITNTEGLSEPLKRKLRRVATIRNKLVHEPDFNAIPDRDGFVRDYQMLELNLKDYKTNKRLKMSNQMRDFQEAKAELTKLAKARGVDIDKSIVCTIQ